MNEVFLQIDTTDCKTTLKSKYWKMSCIWSNLGCHFHYVIKSCMWSHHVCGLIMHVVNKFMWSSLVSWMWSIGGKIFYVVNM